MVLSTSYGLIRFLRLTGLPLGAASILAILLIESRPMDLNELSRLTGYAKSHLSSMARLLEEKKLIERIVVRGRKVVFRARREAIIDTLRHHLSELRSALQNISHELKADMDHISVLERSLSELIARLEGDRNGVY